MSNSDQRSARESGRNLTCYRLLLGRGRRARGGRTERGAGAGSGSAPGFDSRARPVLRIQSCASRSGCSRSSRGRRDFGALLDCELAACGGGLRRRAEVRRTEVADSGTAGEVV